MKCVLIGAGEIENYPLLRGYIESGDFVICCDGGLDHAARLQASPSLIVGDFDSHEKPKDGGVETICLPCEKDDTDMAYALKTALARGFDELLLLGATGGRLDHTLVNISLLRYAAARGARAVIADDLCEMEIVGKAPVFVPRGGAYFSLINMGGIARGVTVKGAKYPLSDAEITSEYQYGVSNEVTADKAEISVKEGDLLLIKIR